MRWGVRDEAQNDHMTTELCLKEIKACQKLSVGPNFVVSMSMVSCNCCNVFIVLINVQIHNFGYYKWVWIDSCSHVSSFDTNFPLFAST